jgi:transcription elongation factor Elf1
MSGDHNMHQKPRSYLDDFECPRCGHCCKSDLARVGEVGVWGECEPQEEVEDGWCNWVCPKPRGYLMQCCDCELIHEVDFRVVRYESEDSEVYEVVDDPNLQAQMRLRRRDDLSPKREWVGLTLNEAEDFYDKYTDRAELINAIDKYLEEKNT